MQLPRTGQILQYTDADNETRVLDAVIAESVIEMLQTEIKIRLQPPDSLNLRVHLDYLALSMIMLMKANEPEGIDGEEQRLRIAKLKGMIDAYAKSFYCDRA